MLVFGRLLTQLRLHPLQVRVHKTVNDLSKFEWGLPCRVAFDNSELGISLHRPAILHHPLFTHRVNHRTNARHPELVITPHH